MALNRLRIRWEGEGVVGPGLTTLYGTGFVAATLPSAAASLFTTLASRFPSGLKWVVPDGGDVIDEATGSLIGAWGTTSETTINAAGSTTFAQGVGLRAVWDTGTIRGGRRVRGSTFFCPLLTTQYENDGTISSTTLTAFEGAAGAYLSALGGEARVWSRPRTGLAGAGVEVTGVTIPDKVSWLRSRRT